jgi:hypothetical protein
MDMLRLYVCHVIDELLLEDQKLLGHSPRDDEKRELQIQRLHAAFDALDCESEGQNAVALVQDKLDRFLTLFRNGQRTELFHIIFEEGNYPVSFWPCFHRVWGNFEGIQHKRTAKLLKKYRGNWSADSLPTVDHYKPDQSTRAVYDSLPEEITIFRGNPTGKPLGLSWTLELKVAEFFARRIGLFTQTVPTVVKATVSKRDVASVVLRESELVLFSARSAKKPHFYQIDPHPYSSVESE